MVIFKKETDLRGFLSGRFTGGKPIGFIPTMGALHAGHCSLIDRAKAAGDFVVCSIFVNPTQFNDKNDFDKYPVTHDEDVKMLLEADCDVLFLPDVAEMYPQGTDQVTSYDFGYLDSLLEGAHRPGHFKGVGQIVGRLLEIVSPRHLYMGQKDYQQCMVIGRLLQLMGRKDQVELVICPTIREADGLAMSSRNARLNLAQRTLAATIYQCLVSIQGKMEADNFRLVQKECMDLLKEKGFEPEYVELANANDLTHLDNYQKDTPMVALIAAKIGGVRLIDNLLLN